MLNKYEIIGNRLWWLAQDANIKPKHKVTIRRAANLLLAVGQGERSRSEGQGGHEGGSA